MAQLTWSLDSSYKLCSCLYLNTFDCKWYIYLKNEFYMTEQCILLTRINVTKTVQGLLCSVLCWNERYKCKKCTWTFIRWYNNIYFLKCIPLSFLIHCTSWKHFVQRSKWKLSPTPPHHHQQFIYLQ